MEGISPCVIPKHVPVHLSLHILEAGILIIVSTKC